MFHLSNHHHQHSSSPPPLHSPLSLSLPCNLFWSIHRLLILTGDGAVLKGGWLTGCLASSGEGLLSGCGTRLEVTVQRARDRNQITTEGQLSCIVCWAPAGTPPSLSPAGHSERSGPPARKTWWDAPLIKHLLLH